MKVSLYVSEHSTRKYRKAKSTEPAGTVYVLRYGGTWETLAIRQTMTSVGSPIVRDVHY